MASPIDCAWGGLPPGRAPIAAKPGQPARCDYEYERNGTANLFMLFAALEGWRHVEIAEPPNELRGRDLRRRVRPIPGAAIDDHGVAVLFADDDQCRPARMSLPAEGNLHDSIFGPSS